jgi:hypothetical protein
MFFSGKNISSVPEIIKVVALKGMFFGSELQNK